MALRKNLKINYWGFFGFFGFYGFYEPAFFLFFLFFLFFIIPPQNSSALIEKQAKEKAGHLQKIKDFMQDKEKVTNKEVANLLGVSDKTVRRYFDELEKEGAVKQVGQDGKNVFYTKF